MQRPKLLVSFSGSLFSYRFLFYITTDQLVRFGLIAAESVSLEDMIGSHFPLLIGIFPPYHTFLVSKEEG